MNVERIIKTENTMMKTKFLTLAAVGALLLAACTTKDDLLNEAPQQLAEEDMPIGFDTYLSNNSKGQTRAAYTVGTSAGLYNADNLTESGFGIFAYLHETEAANNSFTGTPNFMYDQKVEYNTTNKVWTYSPLKYWPNMTANDNRTGNGATMSKTQYVSFFAYAPYIPTATADNSDYLNSADGIVKDKDGTDRAAGITNIVANTGDAAAPTITYKVNSNASECTDLLWATAPLGGLKYATVKGGGLVNIPAGMPLVNLVKPDTQTKLKFAFQHALTAMKMTIQLAVDQVEGGGTLDSNTKVYVESITLTSSKKNETSPIGFATEGKLNLQNTAAFTPRWETTGTSGTWNGDLTISSSGNVTINSALTANNTGVTTDVQGVFSTNKDHTLMFIPVFSEAGDLPVTVSVTYKVVTTDANYNNEKVETTNTISNSVVLKNYKAGRIYNLKLVLGLTSVKIDAEAQDWAVEESTVDLPRNLE